jgi:hypothetical protein
MTRIFKLWVFAAMLAVGGCATLPTGPSVMVLPAPGKPFDQFRVEDATCQQWAAQRIGMTPQEIHNQNMATGAVVGTVVGAGLGAAIGAASGNAGTGAAIGAGSGLLLGTATGSDSGRVYGVEAQRRYDHAYIQCMYAHGNQVPGVRRTYRQSTAPPPPPPPGYNQAPSVNPPTYQNPPPAQ